MLYDEKNSFQCNKYHINAENPIKSKQNKKYLML